MAININHKTGTISSEGNQALNIGRYGVIKLGNGKYNVIINGNSQTKDVTMRGALRFNEADDKLELCDGNSWTALGEAPDANPIVWSMIL